MKCLPGDPKILRAAESRVRLGQQSIGREGTPFWMGSYEATSSDILYLVTP